MNILGGISDGGMERRNVVDVPRERSASPGAETATTVAGLSPVNGAMTQSSVGVVNEEFIKVVLEQLTWIKSPPLDPPTTDFTQNSTSFNRLRT